MTLKISLLKRELLVVISLLISSITVLPFWGRIQALGIPFSYSEMPEKLVCLLFIPWAIWRRDILKNSLATGWILALFTLACLISGWHDVHHGKMIVFLAATILGIMISVEYSQSERSALLLSVLATLVWISAYAAVFYPHVGVTNGTIYDDIKHAGTWRGVFWHKMFLGRITGLASVLFIYSILSSGRPYKTGVLFFFKIFTILISLVALWKSQCATSFVAMSAALIAMGILFWKEHNLLAHVLVATGITVCLLVAVFTFHHPSTDIIPNWMLKDPTMSSRTLLWQEVFNHALHRPFLGYGFYFWQGSPDAAQINYALHFPVFSAHNGFMDALLSLGFIGLLLLIAALLRDFTRAAATHSWEILLFFTYFVVENMADSVIVDPYDANALWIMWVAFSFSNKNK